MFAATESIAPLERLERALHPWVGFVIMPVFALANAGVDISIGGVKDPIALAVLLGLFVGKPVGIVGASWLVVKLGWGQLPDRTSWRALTGGACLGGIGFTMALFVASLSLRGEHLDAAKTGVLAASALSMVLGLALLLTTFPTNGPKGSPGGQPR